MRAYMVRSQGAVHMQSIKKVMVMVEGKANWPTVWGNPTGENGLASAVR